MAVLSVMKMVKTVSIQKWQMQWYVFQLFILLFTVFGIQHYVESRQTLLLRRALCIS